MNVGCVLMAAGNAARFGGNKLLAEFRGKPLIRCALDAIPKEALSGVAVVSQYDEILALAPEYGFTAVKNENPELGVSRTVRLGTAALANTCDGLIYQVADQPLLQKSTVLHLAQAFCKQPDRIIVPTANGRRGNPCIFPRRYFEELQNLKGDRGGSQVIRRHAEAVLGVEVPAHELIDVDTAETLQKLDGLR